jgi:hypothetical protein
MTPMSRTGTSMMTAMRRNWRRADLGCVALAGLMVATRRDGERHGTTSTVTSARHNAAIVMVP